MNQCQKRRRTLTLLLFLPARARTMLQSRPSPVMLHRLHAQVHIDAAVVMLHRLRRRHAQRAIGADTGWSLRRAGGRGRRGRRARAGWESIPGPGRPRCCDSEGPPRTALPGSASSHREAGRDSSPPLPFAPPRASHDSSHREASRDHRTDDGVLQPAAARRPAAPAPPPRPVSTGTTPRRRGPSNDAAPA